MNSSAPQNGSDFADLKKFLAAQDATNSGEASAALLITFIDILALLIGELLTSIILRLAWVHHFLKVIVWFLGFWRMYDKKSTHAICGEWKRYRSSRMQAVLWCRSA